MDGSGGMAQPGPNAAAAYGIPLTPQLDCKGRVEIETRKIGQCFRPLI